ncbi:MAG: T9SS type A sorting domain-containing protein [Chryseolinea sp.]
MRNFLLLVILMLASLATLGQGFEIVPLQESYKGTIGEVIKAPIRFKNTSDKPIVLIIRKISGQIGGTQKNFLCLDANCLDQRAEDQIVKVEAGQTLSSLQVALEAGLVSGLSSVRYIAYNKSNPSQSIEFEVNFIVEEKAEKQSIYTSKFMMLKDVYPNPVIDHALVDYKILNEQIKAKIVIHNILGNNQGEYELLSSENLLRIPAEGFSAGIYFYTLYINNEGVVTRKLIVKK